MCGPARTALGLVSGLALALSAGALGMAAVAAGAAPGPTTAGTAPASAPAQVSTAPTPCSPRSDGACTVAPTSLKVTFPSGTSVVSGVAVTWTTTGRPAGTGPAHTSTFLKLTGGGCPQSTANTTCTWAWPKDLEASGSSVVLNGSYLVQPCTGTSATPTCPAPSGTPNLLIAAPPAPPGGVRASGSSSSVTVSWAAGPEPDLAGYAVTRNDVVVFTCNVHGAPLPGSVPCSSQLAYTDRLGSGGAVVYGVVAKRFALSSDPATYLTSRPAVASINLGSGSIGPLPAIPVIGTPNVPLPGAPPSTGAGAGAGASAPPTTVDPGSGGLEYGAQDPGALGPVRGALAGHTTSVARLALLATGLLVLALAAHLLYLRGAIARYQMAHGGPATRGGAHLRQRPPMRVQWGQWPPLVRDGGDLPSTG